MTREPKPNLERDELHASTSFRELFRYRKGERIRSYQLRVLSETSAALWVWTEGGRQEPRSRKLMTLSDPTETASLLDSIEQELRTGGWSRV